MTLPRTQHRTGLSLLEVILALAILGGALAALGEVVRTGSQAAQRSRDELQAQSLCESLLAEMSAGVLYPETVNRAELGTLDPTRQWFYSVQVEPVDQDALLAVRVTVEEAADASKLPASYSLTRWMLDPEVIAQIEEEAAEAAALQEAASGTSSSSSSGSSSSGSGSGGSGGSSSGGAGGTGGNRG